MVKCLQCIQRRMLRQTSRIAGRKHAHHELGLSQLARPFANIAPATYSRAEGMAKQSAPFPATSVSVVRTVSDANLATRSAEVPSSAVTLGDRDAFSTLRSILSREPRRKGPLPSIHSILSAINSLASHQSLHLLKRSRHFSTHLSTWFLCYSISSRKLSSQQNTYPTGETSSISRSSRRIQDMERVSCSNHEQATVAKASRGRRPVLDFVSRFPLRRSR